MVAEENSGGEYIYPRLFFGQSKIKTTKGSCFVIMPFDPKMDEVYSEIRSICKEFGLTAVRADEIYDVKPIMISIMRKIGEADILIADLTGRNPNVFYELGISHMVSERVVLITQDMEDAPFDLRHHRLILYNGPDRLTRLRYGLERTFSNLGIKKLEVPLTGFEMPKKGYSEMISTSIHFLERGQGQDELTWFTRKMRDVIIKFVAPEKVKIDFSPNTPKLEFDGGIFEFVRSEDSYRPVLTVFEGIVEAELRGVLLDFGFRYRSIEFALRKHFNFAELHRISPFMLKQVSPTEFLFELQVKGALVSLRNVRAGGIGSIISVTSASSFNLNAPPINYQTLLDILLGESHTIDPDLAQQLGAGG